MWEEWQTRRDLFSLNKRSIHTCKFLKKDSQVKIACFLNFMTYLHNFRNIQVLLMVNMIIAVPAFL